MNYQRISELYTFSKNYFNDTTDLITEALAMAYEAWVFIHLDKIQQHSENNVGVDFPSIIYLVKTGQHCDLLKQIMMMCHTMKKRRKKVMVIARKR